MSSSTRNTVLVKDGGLSNESINLGPNVLAMCPSISISASLLRRLEILALPSNNEMTNLTVLGVLFEVMIFCASLIPFINRFYQVSSVK